MSSLDCNTRQSIVQVSLLNAPGDMCINIPWSVNDKYEGFGMRNVRVIDLNVCGEVVIEANH